MQVFYIVLATAFVSYLYIVLKPIKPYGYNRQIKFTYLLTKATELSVGQRCSVFSAKMSLGIKILCFCVVCRKKSSNVA